MCGVWSAAFASKPAPTEVHRSTIRLMPNSGGVRQHDSRHARRQAMRQHMIRVRPPTRGHASIHDSRHAPTPCHAPTHDSRHAPIRRSRLAGEPAGPVTFVVSGSPRSPARRFVDGVSRQPAIRASRLMSSRALFACNTQRRQGHTQAFDFAGGLPHCACSPAGIDFAHFSQRPFGGSSRTVQPA